jgi:sterol O-acyltransferase
MAVVAGGKGGGFEGATSGPAVETNGSKAYQSLKVPSNSRPGPPRLKSIPVTLNKLKEKGRYILTADDDALREILKTGIERVIGIFTSLGSC